MDAYLLKWLRLLALSRPLTNKLKEKQPFLVSYYTRKYHSNNRNMEYNYLISCMTNRKHETMVQIVMDIDLCAYAILLFSRKKITV